MVFFPRNRGGGDHDLPTQMRAVCCRHVSAAIKRRVTLFPIHSIILAPHCDLPILLPPNVICQDAVGSTTSMPAGGLGERNDPRCESERTKAMYISSGKNSTEGSPLVAKNLFPPCPEFLVDAASVILCCNTARGNLTSHGMLRHGFHTYGPTDPGGVATHHLAMAPLSPPLSDTKFTLNAWGVAGIFGGEEAISTVALIPLYPGRRWLGWYNSPGSLQVARHFGRLAHSSSQFWQRIFPHPTKSPAILFTLDSQAGPRYTAALSGTEMQTDYLGYLAMERCKEVRMEAEIPGRKTTPAHVALIDLGNVDYDSDPRLSRANTFLALIPIIVSIATCVMCALVHDWYSFSVIFVGIVASGFATVTIGSNKLILESVGNPARGSPPGDGILLPVNWEDMVVVVKGAEHAVSAITKGKFGLERSGRVLGHAIGISSLLLVLEFLAQLFLIPQGILFGQLMFVISLCVSWVYNFHISSLGREKLQADVLFQKLGNPKIRKFLLGTRTTMAVFVALLVFHGVPDPSPIAVQKMLRCFFPDDTDVWEKWRGKVAQQVCNKSLSCLELDKEGDDKGLKESEKEFLGILLGDARAGYDGYSRLPYNRCVV